MMGFTDRHFRFFVRQITKHTLLYTEMITTGALLYGDTAKFLAYQAAEHPLAIQLGGSDPKALAKCAKMAEKSGFCEINLNVGCPSERVQSGRFGLCLMKEPQLVASCVQAMKAAVNIPVTVKTRIGVDGEPNLEQLLNFIGVLHESGTDQVCLHARSGWLKGLNPKENRTIPPLNYDMAYAVKEHFPDLSLGINGGIASIDNALEHLLHVDAVMIGRAAYHNPFLLQDADQYLFACTSNNLSRDKVIATIFAYIAKEVELGTPIQHMSKHLLNFFHAQPGAKAFKRYISDHIYKMPTLQTLEKALLLVA